MRPQGDNWDVSYAWVNCDLCGGYIGGEPSWGRNDITFAVCPLCSDSLGWPYPYFDDDDDDDDEYDYCDVCGVGYPYCECDDEDENEPQRELGGE